MPRDVQQSAWSHERLKPFSAWCRARTAAEAQKHLKRRRKRKREKAGLDGEDPPSKAEDELAASDELVAMQASTRDSHKQQSDGETGSGVLVQAVTLTALAAAKMLVAVSVHIS